MNNLLTHTLLALFPKGSAWGFDPNGDLYKLISGIGESFNEVKLLLDKLVAIRDPDDTIVLSELTEEIGIVIARGVSDDETRAILHPYVYQKNTTGATDLVQNRLRDSGFDVYVYDNEPPVDPSAFVNAVPTATCGDPDIVFGGDTAFFGKANDNKLLVNSNLIYHSTDPLDPNRRVTYEVPSDPLYYPLIFFVGGEVTRNIEGEIIEIMPAFIRGDRRSEFEQLVLKYKPLHSWAGMIIEATN